MTLFAPAPRRRSRARTVGWAFLIGAVVLGLLASLLPSPYLIEVPGPVYNTIGTQKQGTGKDAKDVKLIQVSGHETYPTAGALDMLTVGIQGDATNRPSWTSVIRAIFTRSQAVIPVEAIYPSGTTTEQVNERDSADMQASQQSAVAAALIQQGNDLPTELEVSAVQEGSAADGAIEKGDVITAFDGRSLTTNADASSLRELVAKHGTSRPATVTVERDGATEDVRVTPRSEQGTALLGVGVTERYEFPFKVSIRLQDVGGPSAGMMFALGIIDEITPGKLNGGKHVAGTGTITADGEVGPIGGIRQKLYGAADAGATVFLAPADNCDEVVGHVPDGLDVYSVSTLDQAVTDLQTIADGGSTAKLARCGS
ncbi:MULTISPECIES: YlbL family protein [Curtobacterium]|uniref:YlbL family protein n=1 Tax=Curtobacterium TaxID=2034 RepID=UPI000DA80635|nr:MULTISPECIES: S16 family serine protease [Curtobacterium]MBT1607217.1 PDZ domain-containing protein [Curtobacterium flaccumfaciens pv. betae]MBT1631144.1 PDZ domain-containing protein [Curtobacterium flaccumfaciens pv. oortii]MBT1657088.1 PDZ domain-containing protein [Curtobacterium flaccumfaciens pv. betae]MCS0471254.1 PDZ domain-containing protein [Curtobacterium flaccumfaciens pv. betae]MCS0474077.1 PDZ domain-containing protein [Curtobacterium flaccumfaciens pv. betae]